MSTDNNRQNRSERRRLVSLSIFVVAVSGLILAAAALRLPPFTWGQKVTRLEVKFDTEPDKSNTAIYTITGYATRPCEVELFQNGVPVGRTVTMDKALPSRPEKNRRKNVFIFPQILLRAGQNGFVARALPLDEVEPGQMPADAVLYLEWYPEPEHPPELYQVPRETSNQVVFVEGASRPNEVVLITLFDAEDQNHPPRRIGVDTRTWADGSGHFGVQLWLPYEGDFRVFAHNKPDEEISEQRQSELISYAPWTKHRAQIGINYDGVSVDLEVIRSKKDRRIQELLSGRKSLPLFLDEEFGLFMGPYPISNHFQDSRPIISFTDMTASIKATAKWPRSEDLPVLEGTLQFGKGYQQVFPAAGVGDSIKVQVKDYEAKSYYPPPTSVEDGWAIWTKDRGPYKYDGPIQVRLAYNPIGSPVRLFRLLRLAPHEIFGYEVYSLFYFPLAFLTAIPLLWFLYLLEKYAGTSNVEPAHTRTFSQIILWFLTVILIFPNLTIPQSFSKTVYDALFSTGSKFKVWSPYQPLVLLTSTVLVSGMLCALVSAAPALIRRLPVKSGAKFFSRGFAYAFAITLGLFIILLGVSKAFEGENNSLVPATVIIFPFLFSIFFCIKRLIELGLNRTPAHPTRWNLLVFLSALILAYPAGKSIYSVSTTQFSVYELTSANVRYFFGLIQELIPYLLLIAVFAYLKRAGQRLNDDNFVVDIGMLLFSAYIVGATSNWFIIPVPFILALILYKKLALQPFDTQFVLAKLKDDLISKRRALLIHALDQNQAQQFVRSIDQVRKKIVAGDLAISDFIKRKQEIESYAREVEGANRLLYGLQPKDVVLSLGPYERNWDNGIHAAKRGLLISLPFLLLFFSAFLIRQIRVGSPFLTLWIVVRLISYIGDWLISAFFFGYFFTQLRGSSGLMKGLNTAVATMICLIPVWLTSGSSSLELSATFLRAGQIFLFFTVLGVWGFDYYTFRITLGDQFSWRRFNQFGEMPAFTAVVSVLLTSAGVAISSAISGQFTALFSQIVKSLFPELPSIR